MKSPLTKLEQEAKRLRLSSRETHAMRASLMARVRASGAGSAAPRPFTSPYFFAPQFTMSMAALLMIVLVGSGTAYAAEGALPGDLLYAIKTKINEPIQGALAFSAADKIQFHSDVIETRLEEAEVLTSQNRLDATTSAELASSIDTQLSDRDAIAQTVDQNDPGAGAQTVALLNASIQAHSDILMALGSEASSSVQEHSDSIAMSARGNHSNSGSGSGPVLAMAAKVAAPMAPSQNAPHPTMMAFSVSEGSASSSDQAASSTGKQDGHHGGQKQNNNNGANSSQEEQAAALGSRATSTLADLRAKAAAMGDKIDSDTQNLLEARFSDIDALIAQGNDSLAQGNYSDAQDSFNQAQSGETTLSAFMSAGVQFDRGILKNLLSHNSHWGDDNQ